MSQFQQSTPFLSPHRVSQRTVGTGPFQRCRRILRTPFLGATLAFLTPALLSLGPAAHAQEAGSSQIEAPVAAPVNINSATMDELAQGLTGVGSSKAEAIVRYREQFGPFESIDELSEVAGIGASTVERNRARIRLQ